MTDDGRGVERSAALAGDGTSAWLEPDGRTEPPATRGRVRRVQKVSEVLAREILEQIFVQRLGPGVKLPSEANMLAEYRVGRASLREALHILEAYGLISIRPGKGGGPVIEDIGPRDFARLMTFYLHVKQVTLGELLASTGLIQVAIAARAAARRDPAQIARMRQALVQAEAGADDAEVGRALEDFYRAMYDVPGGEVLRMIGDALHEIIVFQVRRRIPGEEVRANLEDLGHLVDAIAAGEVVAAEGTIQEQLQKSRFRYEGAMPGIFAERTPWV